MSRLCSIKTITNEHTTMNPVAYIKQITEEANEDLYQRITERNLRCLLSKNTRTKPSENKNMLKTILYHYTEDDDSPETDEFYDILCEKIDELTHRVNDDDNAIQLEYDNELTTITIKRLPL